jgi:hypothetical protein
MLLSFCGASGKLSARVTVVETVYVHEIWHKSEE